MLSLSWAFYWCRECWGGYSSWVLELKCTSLMITLCCLHIVLPAYRKVCRMPQCPEKLQICKDYFLYFGSSPDRCSSASSSITFPLCSCWNCSCVCITCLEASWLDPNVHLQRMGPFSSALKKIIKSIGQSADNTRLVLDCEYCTNVS